MCRPSERRRSRNERRAPARQDRGGRRRGARAGQAGNRFQCRDRRAADAAGHRCGGAARQRRPCDRHRARAGGQEPLVEEARHARLPHAFDACAPNPRRRSASRRQSRPSGRSRCSSRPGRPRRSPTPNKARPSALQPRHRRDTRAAHARAMRNALPLVLSASPFARRARRGDGGARLCLAILRRRRDARATHRTPARIYAHRRGTGNLGGVAARPADEAGECAGADLHGRAEVAAGRACRGHRYRRRQAGSAAVRRRHHAAACRMAVRVRPQARHPLQRYGGQTAELCLAPRHRLRRVPQIHGLRVRLRRHLLARARAEAGAAGFAADRRRVHQGWLSRATPCSSPTSPRTQARARSASCWCRATCPHSRCTCSRTRPPPTARRGTRRPSRANSSRPSGRSPPALYAAGLDEQRLSS